MFLNVVRFYGMLYIVLINNDILIINIKNLIGGKDCMVCMEYLWIVWENIIYLYEFGMV